MSIIISEQIKQEIIEFYKQQPISLEKMSDKFGYCQPTISKILKQGGCTIYKKAQVYNPNLKENYFEYIDDEYKAYFLGLLITDSNVFLHTNNGRQASISIQLQNQDKYIIEIFKQQLNAQTNIRYDKRDNSCAFAIRSDKMAQDLSKYGVIARKTQKTYLPYIDNFLMPHLLRGILDGDGCIQYTQDGKRIHEISFCGTPQLIGDIKQYLMGCFPQLSNRKIYYYSDTFCDIRWNKVEDVKNIGLLLYNNANIFLVRKHNKFVQFLNYYNL